MVCGSRSIKNKDLVFKILNKFLLYDITEIIHGNADGVDKLAKEYAIINNIIEKSFEPEWAKYGKGAGIIRNTEMVNYCDRGIAIWDGKSKGTLDSVKKLEKNNKLLYVYRVK
jgi:hypothetical protein